MTTMLNEEMANSTTYKQVETDTAATGQNSVSNSNTSLRSRGSITSTAGMVTLQRLGVTTGKPKGTVNSTTQSLLLRTTIN